MYSPKIPEKFIPRLWRLGKKRGVPMTRLVAEAIEEYLKREEEENDQGVFVPHSGQSQF